MSIRNKEHIVEVKIEHYSKKGNGVGYFQRQDGTLWPVEVSFTVPGDKVLAKLLRKKGGMYQSILKEILEPSSSRIKPLCVHFSRCGGCRWQQIPYGLQLKNKQEKVLSDFEGMISSDVEVFDIIACEDNWHYRNKMEFTFSSDLAKEKYLGLILDSSRGKVFNIAECHLPNPWFVKALTSVRQWWRECSLDAYHARKNTGSLRTLTLREGQRTGDRMVNLTVSGNPDYALKTHHLESFTAFVRSAVEPDDPHARLSIFLTIHQAIKGQPSRFFEMHLYGADHIREVLRVKVDAEKEPLPLTFKISSSAFFQPNTRQAEVLYSAMLRMLQIPRNAVVYDLYCGTGTLGICAAKMAKKVIGIELAPEAVLDANFNAAQNSLKNIEFLKGRVHERLKEIKEKNLFPLPDIVLVDPPRVGLEGDALKQILSLSPEKIVYISCNPATQAKDIKELIKNGYCLLAVQPVDQFPHTVHIENIAILSKA